MKYLSLLFLILFTPYAQAECVATFKQIVDDERTGNIIVETDYVLNGSFVKTGRVRYNDDTGNAQQIETKVSEDMQRQCEILIAGIPGNKSFLKDQRKEAQKQKLSSIKTSLETRLVGKFEIVDSLEVDFKGKKIKVTHDQNNTVSDIPGA